MRWTEYAADDVAFSVVSMLVLYADSAIAGLSAIQSAECLASIRTPVAPRFHRFGIQYGGVFYHQHELAKLCARSNDELPDADGGARLSQLHFGRVGNGFGNCFHSRHCPARNEDARQLLGRHGTRSALDLLPLCIVWRYCLVSQGVVQNFSPTTRHSWWITAITIEVDKKDADGNVITDAQGNAVKETQPVTEQTIAQGPVASQNSSRSWAPMAAASSMSTPLIHSKTRHLSQTSWRCSRSFAISAGFTYTLGRMTGSQKHGWAVFAAMAVLFFAGRAGLLTGPRPEAIRLFAGMSTRPTSARCNPAATWKARKFASE